MLPLINLKIHVGHTLNPYIELYNPHDHVLSVKEVFTNEGFLHLKLPKGAKKSSKGGLWEMAPMTWAKVMSVSFHSTRAGRHMGFVHVRTNVDTLVVPVEVNVMKGGVHRWPDLLDFETLTSSSEKRELNISVLNSTPNPLLVTDVAISSPDPSLRINLKRGTVLQANSEAVIATAVYSGKTQGRFAGKLVLRTNDTVAANKALELPYEAKVVHGKLGYSKANASFAVSMAARNTKGAAAGKSASSAEATTSAEVVERWLSLTNEFSVPVHLLAAVVEDAAFEVVRFPTDRVLQPRETAPPVVVRYTSPERKLPSSSNPSLPTTNLAIHTNVSTVKIALHVYHGGLSITGADLELMSVATESSSWSRDEEGGSSEPTVSSLLLDMGILGVRDEREFTINITNSNPVPIDIYDFHWMSGKVDSISMKLVHVLDGGAQEVDDSKTTAALSKLVQGVAKGKGKSKGREAAAAAVINPGHSLCLQVLVLSQAEEQVDELVKIHTNFEIIEIRMRYASMVGTLTLEPQVLELPPAFPGKIVREAVFATSTYRRPLTITAMSSSEARIRATVMGPAHNATAAQASGLVLEPGVRTLIGYVTFDPSLGAAKDNYMAAAVWKKQEQMDDVLTSEGVVRPIDFERMDKLSRLWETVSASRQVSANITVNSDMVKGLTLKAVGTLEKPDILSAGQTLNFPLTQAGQASEQYLSVENPSDLPMLSSLVLAPPPGTDANTADKRNNLLCKTAQSCAASSHFLASRAHMAATMVPPRSWARLGPIFFVPKAEGVYSATAYVRNNLTLLHAVGLRGEAGAGKLEMSEGLHGAQSCDVLRFDVARGSYLDNPLAETQGIGSEGSAAAEAAVPPAADESDPFSEGGRGALGGVFGISKVLTLRNAGSLPVTVYSMALNAGKCEFQGLKVHGCGRSDMPLEILPRTNSTIRMSFTPDCTLHRVRVDLVARTSVGTFKYPVEATVAPAELEACYRRISQAGAGGILQGARHVSLCRVLLVFLVCLCLVVARAARPRHRPRARQGELGTSPAEGRLDEGSKQCPEEGNLAASDQNQNQNRAKALAHLEQMRRADVSEPSTVTVAASPAAAAAKPCAKDKPAADAAGRKQDPDKAGPAAEAPQANTPGSAKRGATKKASTGVKTPSPAAVANGSGGHCESVADGSDSKGGSWELAGAPKAVKQAAHKDKPVTLQGKGPGAESAHEPSLDANHGFPPVTGTFDIVKEPPFPIGAAAAWALQDRALDAAGQGPPLMPGGPAGGLALFGGLDSTFTHSIPSQTPVWPGGAGFFSAMPCDPADSYPGPSSMHMLGAGSGLVGGSTTAAMGVEGGSGLGTAGGGGDSANFDFVFRIPPHMPAADFPLED